MVSSLVRSWAPGYYRGSYQLVENAFGHPQRTLVILFTNSLEIHPEMMQLGDGQLSCPQKNLGSNTTNSRVFDFNMQFLNISTHLWPGQIRKWSAHLKVPGTSPWSWDQDQIRAQVMNGTASPSYSWIITHDFNNKKIKEISQTKILNSYMYSAHQLIQRSPQSVLCHYQLCLNYYVIYWVFPSLNLPPRSKWVTKKQGKMYCAWLKQ
jgi:hypothetical protein